MRLAPYRDARSSARSSSAAGSILLVEPLRYVTFQLAGDAKGDWSAAFAPGDALDRVRRPASAWAASRAHARRRGAAGGATCNARAVVALADRGCD